MSRRKRSRTNGIDYSSNTGRLIQAVALLTGSVAIWYSGGREFLSSCHQIQSCCANTHFPKHPSDYITATYNGTEFTMAVRLGAPHDYDLVSTALRASGGYSISSTNKIISALQRLGSNSMLLDIGAGLGWHTLTAALTGHRVIAFEPFHENVALLNASLCTASSRVRDSVTIMPYALGAIPADGAQCELWQQSHGDRGAPLTICGTGDAATVPLAALRKAGYGRLAHAKIRALDELMATRQLIIEENTPLVLHFDVGGWEPMAAEGCRELFRTFKPQTIFATFAPKDIQRAALTTGSTTREARWRPGDFLRFMQASGYEYKLNSRSYRAVELVEFTREPESVIQATVD